MASKVFFADLRTNYRENLQQKLTRLLKTAGMGEIDFDNKFVAIKLHFGEPGNLAYLRPNWAKTVADFIKERGGKPFLTDCNTLYVGGRKNALDHMDSAMVKVSNKVDQTTASLPSSCLTPSIIEYSLNMNAFMTVAVSREGSDVYDLSEFVSDTLVPYVERKGGVSSVSTNGQIEKMVQVQLSQEKIDAINEKLLEVIDVQLADARKQLELSLIHI